MNTKCIQLDRPQHNLVIDFITIYMIVNFPKALYTLVPSLPGTLHCANQSSALQLFKKNLINPFQAWQAALLSRFRARAECAAHCHWSSAYQRILQPLKTPPRGASKTKAGQKGNGILALCSPATRAAENSLNHLSKRKREAYGELCVRRMPHQAWHKALDGEWKFGLGGKEQGEFKRNLAHVSGHFTDTEAI